MSFAPAAKQVRGDGRRDPVRQTTEDAIGPRRDGDRPHVVQPQVEPAGQRGWTEATCGLPSWRLVSVVISTSGCRKSSLMSSRAV